MTSLHKRLIAGLVLFLVAALIFASAGKTGLTGNLENSGKPSLSAPTAISEAKPNATQPAPYFPITQPERVKAPAQRVPAQVVV